MASNQLLATTGYNVMAIDLNQRSPDELSSATRSLNVTMIRDDVWHAPEAALVWCCGDTITHPDRKAIRASDKNAGFSGAFDMTVPSGLWRNTAVSPDIPLTFLRRGLFPVLA